MGLLVGLPLKLFYFLFTALRLVWPLLMIWLVIVILRRWRAGKHSSWKKTGRSEPDFDGPVYTVDYEVVESPEEQDNEGR